MQKFTRIQLIIIYLFLHKTRFYYQYYLLLNRINLKQYFDLFSNLNLRLNGHGGNLYVMALTPLCIYIFLRVDIVARTLN